MGKFEKRSCLEKFIWQFLLWFLFGCKLYVASWLQKKIWTLILCGSGNYAPLTSLLLLFQVSTLAVWTMVNAHNSAFLHQTLLVPACVQLATAWRVGSNPVKVNNYKGQILFEWDLQALFSIPGNWLVCLYESCSAAPSVACGIFRVSNELPIYPSIMKWPSWP